MNDQKKRLPYLKVFGDWLCRFQTLDDAQFGRFIRAAIAYVCAGEEPNMDGVERLSFDFIRPALDMDIIRYREKVEKNTENGAKGAAARWGIDSERHTADSERHIADSENSQEKREKKEEKRYKINDTRVRDVPERPNTPMEETSNGDSMEAFEDAWRAYYDMLDNIGQSIEPSEIGPIIERLRAITGEDPVKMAQMLNQATKAKRPLNDAGAVIGKVVKACSL